MITPYAFLFLITRTPSIAHELARMLFAFRRDGLLETVGPAGTLAEFAIFLL